MKRIIPFIVTIVCVPLFFLVAGCQTTTVDTVTNAVPNASPSPIEDLRIQTDKSLGKDLDIVSVSESVSDGNFLKVQVIVRNNKSKPANYSYIFEWFDREGIAIRSAVSGWKSVRLQGKEEKAIVTVATSQHAADFKFKIQEANPKVRLP